MKQNIYCQGIKTTLIVWLLIVCSPASAEQKTWSSWSVLLGQAVSAEGFVDYNRIQASDQLSDVLRVIKTTDFASLQSQKQKLVFYINTYNALVIQTILAGKSPSNFFSRLSFFKGTEYNVAGTIMNLHQLEHDVIRLLNDPRIHFALVCASRSCPKLLNQTYQLEVLDQQLDNAARYFINDKDKNFFNRDTKTAHLSKIFDWFDEDFTRRESHVLDYIAAYIDDPMLAKQLQKQSFSVDFNTYHWTLNGSFKKP
jgi:hypothetical protein